MGKNWYDRGIAFAVARVLQSCPAGHPRHGPQHQDGQGLLSAAASLFWHDVPKRRAGWLGIPGCELALHIHLVILRALAASFRPVIASQLPVCRHQQAIRQVLVLLSPIELPSFLCTHSSVLQ